MLSKHLVFCENLDGGLFTGDKEFIKIFTEVFQTLVSFGKDRSGVTQYDWQMISLMAINDISSCLSYNAAVGKSLLLCRFLFYFSHYCKQPTKAYCKD